MLPPIKLNGLIFLAVNILTVTALYIYVAFKMSITFNFQHVHHTMDIFTTDNYFPLNATIERQCLIDKLWYIIIITWH